MFRSVSAITRGNQKFLFIIQHLRVEIDQLLPLLEMGQGLDEVPTNISGWWCFGDSRFQNLPHPLYIWNTFEEKDTATLLVCFLK